MSFIRRHVSAAVAIWSLSQCAFVLGLLPRDCCAAHQSHASSVVADEETSDSAHCPMEDHSSEPAAAPQTSRTAPDLEQPAPPTRDDECRLRGTCDGPLAAFASLFPNPAIAGQTVRLFPDLTIRSYDAPPLAIAMGVLAHPDSPPPRA